MTQQRFRPVGCLMQSTLDGTPRLKSLPYADSATMQQNVEQGEANAAHGQRPHTAGKEVSHVRDDVSKTSTPPSILPPWSRNWSENLSSRDIARARKRMPAGCEIRSDRTFRLLMVPTRTTSYEWRSASTTTAWLDWKQQSRPVHSYSPPKTHG